MPIYVHLIDHPAGRILVDTGFTELHPPWQIWSPQSVRCMSRASTCEASTASSTRTFTSTTAAEDHLFPNVPIYVQRAELEDARTQPDYTIPEWVDPAAQTLNYVSIDGDHELLLACGCSAHLDTLADHRSLLLTPSTVSASSLVTPQCGRVNSMSRRRKVSVGSWHCDRGGSGSHTKTHPGAPAMTRRALRV